ncbi:hypothetical protein BDK51DRAFT_25911 [Blyttiomyces helicus]|uniref:Cyclin N-terminal domain-containing protein n=1 Tax=Blyttiomyces helicus TaxID=388810 RepID=A0A4P9W9J7_9FUNG|nr:hypothetical protein BDK51DRAFT_25911 [Blyttiomyces helicus]|eukprot:RKO87480.1 hypothetical protein BDK51DRAFT_25911 [Blyttiomyces helicus]
MPTVWDPIALGEVAATVTARMLFEVDGERRAGAPDDELRGFCAGLVCDAGVSEEEVYLALKYISKYHRPCPLPTPEFPPPPPTLLFTTSLMLANKVHVDNVVGISTWVLLSGHTRAALKAAETDMLERLAWGMHVGAAEYWEWVGWVEGRMGGGSACDDAGAARGGVNPVAAVCGCGVVGCAGEAWWAGAECAAGTGGGWEEVGSEQGLMSASPDAWSPPAWSPPLLSLPAAADMMVDVGPGMGSSSLEFALGCEGRAGAGVDPVAPWGPEGLDNVALPPLPPPPPPFPPMPCACPACLSLCFDACYLPSQFFVPPWMQ